MMPHPTLSSIIAHARSGALDRACKMFLDAGMERIDDDPAVLSVRGRLLKDRALAAQRAERKQLYREAADAYVRAGEIGGATYPLINAATLSLLAGKRERAETLARSVLERTLRADGEPETPYYRAATRAEALLLLGDVAQAEDDFADAIARAPRAYEDHASTLRQFSLILDALGEDKAWLDAYRPPRSLHFAGHMATATDDNSIARKIRAAIHEERIGFAYGALAAGADILIAEALLEENVELHLVLPATQARFREISVERFGENWAARFDRIVVAAETVRSLGRKSNSVSQLALQLAAEVAMGRAIMQADMLMTEAVQLLILDANNRRKHEAGGSGWIATRWETSGFRQHVLAAPRVRWQSDDTAPDDDVAPSQCLAAMLRIELGNCETAAAAAEILPKLARTIAAGPEPLLPPRWTGETLLAAYDTPALAARTALSAAATLGDAVEFRMAGHYAIVQRMADPFGDLPFLVGAEAAIPGQVARSAPSGAIHLSEDFAAALHIETAAGRPSTEFVGELPPDGSDEPFRLYSLKP